MEKPTKRERVILLVVTAFVVFAWICRIVHFPSEGGYNVIRAAVYPAVIIFWAYTLHHRLIHRQVRHLMASIALLLLFWFSIRTIKYSLPDQMLDLTRYLWYLFYLPMLFIPALALLTALSVGMPENQRLPKKYNIIWFIAFAIFLLVITNDLHQLVFAFPDSAVVWTDRDYSYGIGYLAYIAWLAFCIPASLIVMAVKNRHLKNRMWGLLPCIPISLLILYLIMYTFSGGRGRWIKMLFGDMTAVSCVLYMLTFELCIRCGLIRSNTGYVELFRAGRLAAQITDHSNKVCLASENAGSFSQEQMISAERQPVPVDKHTLLESKQISFGHVLWQEDISEISETISEIEENMQELAEQSRIHRERIKAEQTILALQEQNHVMDLLHRKTAGQIERIESMLAEYDREKDESARLRLLAGAATVGAYIKRYGNLLLVSEQNETADISDLTRCFEESFSNLELMNVDCLCSLPANRILYMKDMLRVYSTFEAILEDGLSDLHHIWVHGREQEGPEGRIRISIEFVCDADLTAHASDADNFSSDSEEYRFTFVLRKGGAEI